MAVVIGEYHVQAWKFSISYKLGLKPPDTSGGVGLQARDHTTAQPGSETRINPPATGSSSVPPWEHSDGRTAEFQNVGPREHEPAERTSTPSHDLGDGQDLDLPESGVPLLDEIDGGELKSQRGIHALLIEESTSPRLLIRGLGQVHGQLSHTDDTGVSILALEFLLTLSNGDQQRSPISFEFSLKVQAGRGQETEHGKGPEPEVIDFAPHGEENRRGKRSGLSTTMLWADRGSSRSSGCLWLWDPLPQAQGSRIAIAIKNPSRDAIILKASVRSKMETWPGMTGMKNMRRFAGETRITVIPKPPTEGPMPMWEDMGSDFLRNLLDTYELDSGDASAAEAAAVAEEKDKAGDEAPPRSHQSTPQVSPQGEVGGAPRNDGVPAKESTFSRPSQSPTAPDAPAAERARGAPDTTTSGTSDLSHVQRKLIFDHKPQVLIRTSKFEMELGILSILVEGNNLGCARMETWQRNISLGQISLGRPISFGGWLPREWITKRGPELGDNQKLYFVIGIFEPSRDKPVETIVKVGDGRKNDNFSKDVSRAVRKLRGLHRFLSLKSVAGFAIYECGAHGRHTHIKDPEAEQYLVALFEAWRAGEVFKAQWQDWIMKNLNRGNPQPAAGSYSIRLVLRWDTYRISFAIMLPVFLSIIAGVTYQELTGDVQTAWSIASYVVTGVGVVAALLTLVTALGPS
ncbi:hypothetical protein QBC47DRAFT_464270 [Echria macrotheca]|uniref:Transmembrane protein n=1 Tax=Echria macrotheca TaxID=438768 RepID=A0AAJ0B3K7_9PEZI|nr:hypothetical protein QBC47DRAFT_464270 [Echria macrotheca]